MTIIRISQMFLQLRRLVVLTWTWQDQSPVTQVFQEMINVRQEAGARPGHWTTLTR